MADEEPECFISQMSRNVWLSLEALGGRVFVDSASADNLDRCTIELNCQWSTSWVDDLSIRIGDEEHPPTERTKRMRRLDKENQEAPETGWDLSDCRLTLLVYEVSEALIAESAAKNDGQPILGQFRYYERVNTSDGVVNDKVPAVHAWTALGPKNFHLLRDSLLAGEKPAFDLGVSVEFPKESVETSWVDTKVHWDGAASLSITSARFGWKRADWDNDADDEIELDDEPAEYVPPREHVEMLASVGKLEAAISKLTLPVWIAAGAAIVAAIWSR